ncbi:MAG: hypothetical protein AAF573_20520 [Bacteroidota bacterium]
MHNQNTTTGYSMANPEEFKMEIISLKRRIRNEIDMVASDYNTNPSPLEKQSKTRMGVLKVHEFRLKEMLEMVENMDTEEWKTYKKDIKEDFDAAYQLFQPEVIR